MKTSECLLMIKIQIGYVLLNGRNNKIRSGGSSKIAKYVIMTALLL